MGFSQTLCCEMSRSDSKRVVCLRLATEQFHEKIISYQDFAGNPSVIDDPNLVVKIGSK